jgi:predicted amidophosphoribosyltransferase
VRKVLELLFPQTCLICGEAGIELCTSCYRQINFRPFHGLVAGIEFSAGAIYNDEISQLILMAKEQNISAARNVLADLLVKAYMELVSEGKSIHPLGLIPIPSSKSSNRTRGYKHSTLLSQRVCNLLSQHLGVEIKVLELLRVNRKISDQSGLNKLERSANLDGAYS